VRLLFAYAMMVLGGLTAAIALAALLEPPQPVVVVDAPIAASPIDDLTLNQEGHR
jgi:hypothetical protein